MKKVAFIISFLIFFLMATPALALGSIIATAIYGAAAAGTFAYAATAFAVNMLVSAVISKVLAPDSPNSQSQPNPGNKQQLPPAGDNKVPVIYGTAYTGGVGFDMSISGNNQRIAWVFALSEVTNTEPGVSVGAPDTITFGNVYWGGKLCIFDPVNTWVVIGLKDESTGEVQNITADYLKIFLYSNGSTSPTNSPYAAYSNQVMARSDFTYQWNTSKQVTNCAFAVVQLVFSQSRGLTGLQQTRFQVINSRSAPGDCIKDYMLSSRYGAAISSAQVDSPSFDALNEYSNQLIRYQDFNGAWAIQKRYIFNGQLETNLKIMQNIQNMADSCNCLIKYNEIYSTWGVIVQKPDYTPVMALNDSNIVSAISVSPTDLANSFNIVEVKFPDGTSKDGFNSSQLDLAVLNPALLYPNEPINKQSINLYLVNNSVQATYLANIFLEASREDLSVQFEVNYLGLQLEAGDIISVTNTNYGWNAKLFRCIKVTEKISDSAQITTVLNLIEYNPAVYDDKTVAQFAPSPNTGIGTATAFGTVPAPTINSTYTTTPNPSFNVVVTASSAGITQYAEIWYSAYPTPTSTQRIFAGTTEIQSNGNAYDINEVMPPVTLFNISAGDWYFFSRMVNSLASSDYSPASAKLVWRPRTFQYTERYLSVAYADDVSGGGFNLSPTGKLYFGLYNSSSASASTTASDYKWYFAEPAFGTSFYLVYVNRSNRKFSFDTDNAVYAAGTGTFVPASTAIFDQKAWSALDPSGVNPNVIDLDHSTGQFVGTGSTTSSVSSGQLTVNNNDNGQLFASLYPFLDFGSGVDSYSVTIASLSSGGGGITIDKYGRIIGFATPDPFYYTFDNFVATAGQTVFTPATRVSGIGAFGTLTGGSGYTDGTYTSVTMTLASGTAATTYPIATIVVAGGVVTSVTITTNGTGFTSTSTVLSANSINIGGTGSGFLAPILTLNGYITGQDLVFQDGLLLEGNGVDYSETSSTVTLVNPTSAGDQISILSYRAIASSNTFENLNIIYSSGSGTSTITYTGLPWQYIDAGDQLCFVSSGTPTLFTVSSVNYTTKQITFTGTVTATAGANIYRYRYATQSYRVFSRYSANFSLTSTYTPTTWAINNGYERFFINGTSINEQDYDVVASAATNFPGQMTGTFTAFNSAQNNLGTSTTGSTIVVTFTVNGQNLYNFAYTPQAFNLFANGIYLIQGSDYTTASGNYTLTQTPANSTTVLQNQTYNRVGAV